MLLNIETTSDVCSVALSKDGKLLNCMEDKEGRSHASKLTVLIDEVLKQESLSVNDLDGISISKGPGSYTGLRIGVSTAKGLCYGADLPLISVHTLQTLTQGFLNNISKYLPKGLNDSDLLVPMIDARRMEIYTAVLNSSNQFVREVEPVILDEHSFEDLLNKGRLIFFGNGAGKAKGVIKHPNAKFINEIHFSATHMIALSEKQFRNRTFEDVAYFEPFYLKAFQATKPKNKLF